jgi:hypothetical protein
MVGVAGGRNHIARISAGRSVIGAVPVFARHGYVPAADPKELNVRRIIRQLVIGAIAAVTLVGLAGPGNAALTVRALWNMDTLPTMVDSAGSDNNGTTRNIKLSGGAYSFNGTSSYATAPDKANLDPGAANVRLSVRLSFTQVPRVGQTYDIVRKGLNTTAGGYYKIEIRRSSTGQAVAACRFRDANGRAGDITGTANLAGKGFVTITCTKTSSGVTVNAGGGAATVAKALGSISNSAGRSSSAARATAPTGSPA